MLLLLACVDSGADTSKPADTGDTDTPGDTDTADTSDTSDTSDTDTAETDSGDTAPAALPGSMEVTGTFGGVPFAFSCDQDDADTRFRRYWSNSVGDISASFGCYDASSLAVSLLNPRVGTFTDPAEGMNFFYGDASGTWLSWYDATPSAWTMSITELTWIDLETFEVTGSLAGTWEAGEVSATFSVQVPCSNC